MRHYSLLTSAELFCCRPATSRSKTSLRHSGRHHVATRSTISTGKSCKSKPATFNWKPLGRTELRETLLHNFYQETNVETNVFTDPLPTCRTQQKTVITGNFRPLVGAVITAYLVCTDTAVAPLRYDKTVLSIYIFKLCVSCGTFSCLLLICCRAEKH